VKEPEQDANLFNSWGGIMGKGEAELAGYRMPGSAKAEVPAKVRDLTDEEWAEVAKFGMFEDSCQSPDLVALGIEDSGHNAYRLVLLYLVRSGLAAEEITGLMDCMSLADFALGLTPEARKARFPMCGYDPEAEPYEIEDVRRGYWLLLFRRLLEFGMDEDEARTWAETWRPMLELPPRPNTIHASIVLEMVGKQRTLHQARVRVKAMLYPFEQWGGALPLNTETICGPPSPKNTPPHD